MRLIKLSIKENGSTMHNKIDNMRDEIYISFVATSPARQPCSEYDDKMENTVCVCVSDYLSPPSFHIRSGKTPVSK